MCIMDVTDLLQVGPLHNQK